MGTYEMLKPQQEREARKRRYNEHRFLSSLSPAGPQQDAGWAEASSQRELESAGAEPWSGEAGGRHYRGLTALFSLVQQDCFGVGTLL